MENARNIEPFENCPSVDGYHKVADLEEEVSLQLSRIVIASFQKVGENAGILGDSQNANDRVNVHY